jgi:uncharacterized membrane protein YfcA
MIGAVAIGLAAGIVAGLLGVGGGVVFVPGLVILLGLDQHHAEATSLLAIVPVAIVGTYRQDRYGNVRRADAVLLGVLSIAGAVAGVALANVISGTVLRDAFAALTVLVAIELVRESRREQPAPARRASAAAAADADALSAAATDARSPDRPRSGEDGLD